MLYSFIKGPFVKFSLLPTSNDIRQKKNNKKKHNVEQYFMARNCGAYDKQIFVDSIELVEFEKNYVQRSFPFCLHFLKNRHIHYTHSIEKKYVNKMYCRNDYPHTH